MAIHASNKQNGIYKTLNPMLSMNRAADAWEKNMNRPKSKSIDTNVSDG